MSAATKAVQLYQHQDGRHALIAPCDLSLLALAFHVEPYMNLRAMLNSANHKRDVPPLHKDHKKPWEGAAFIAWPDARWRAVSPEEVHQAHQASCRGREVALTQGQRELLAALHKGKMKALGTALEPLAHELAQWDLARRDGRWWMITPRGQRLMLEPAQGGRHVKA